MSMFSLSLELELISYDLTNIEIIIIFLMR